MIKNKLRAMFNAMADIQPISVETAISGISITSGTLAIAGRQLGRGLGRIALPMAAGYAGHLLATTALGHGSLQSLGGFLGGAMAFLAIQDLTEKETRVPYKHRIEDHELGVYQDREG